MEPAPDRRCDHGREARYQAQVFGIVTMIGWAISLIFGPIADVHQTGRAGRSRRAPRSGADASTGRDARLLDPATEPARVRALYTHPDFARRGVGGLVLSLCEAAAAREGFRSLELVATVAGEPLYLAC